MLTFHNFSIAFLIMSCHFTSSQHQVRCIHKQIKIIKIKIKIILLPLLYFKVKTKSSEVGHAYYLFVNKTPSGPQKDLADI